MPNQKIGQIGRFSSLASDPLRGFRFYAEFVVADGDKSTFTNKILDSKDKPEITGSKTSTGFVGGFTQIGGLQVQIADIAYREGGFNVTTHHVPGLVTYPNVVFQRGVLYGNDQAIDWVKGLVNITSGSGLNPKGKGAAKGYRVNVNIYVADHPNTGDELRPKMRFTLHNAWITNLTYTDLNSVANEVMFETMTLVHEGMTVGFADNNGNFVS